MTLIGYTWLELFLYVVGAITMYYYMLELQIQVPPKSSEEAKLVGPVRLTFALLWPVCILLSLFGVAGALHRLKHGKGK